MFGIRDFEIVSYVENVRYTTDSFYPCEVMLYNGDVGSGLQPHTYLRSDRSSLCEFAENAKLRGVSVRVKGNNFMRQQITAIESSVIPTHPSGGFHTQFQNNFPNQFPNQFPNPSNYFPNNFPNGFPNNFQNNFRNNRNNNQNGNGRPF